MRFLPKDKLTEEDTERGLRTVIKDGLAAGIGSILGGQFADFFAKREVSWTFRWTSPGSQILSKMKWEGLYLSIISKIVEIRLSFKEMMK